MKNVQDIYPLTPLQKGLLYHILEGTDNDVYLSDCIHHVSGSINVTLFQQAWSDVVHRHPALRTLVIWENLDNPLQVVQESVSVPFQYLDWSSLTNLSLVDRLEDFRQKERQQGLSLTKAPLLKVTIIKCGIDQFKVYSLYSHIILDGWSSAIIHQEVLTLYIALCQGITPQLIPAPLYLDYVEWQYLKETYPAECFWRQILPNHQESSTKLFPFHSRPEKNNNLQTIKIQLNTDQTTSLQCFAQEHNLTLNSVVQGAWAILLSRYTGNNHITYGMTVSGRTPELNHIDKMVGLLINTLPVPVEVKPKENCVAWYHYFQNRLAEIREFEHVSLAQIGQWCGSSKGDALFDHILVFENYPTRRDQKLENPLQLKVESVYEKSNYPLTICINPSEELQLLFNFNPHLAPRDTVQSLANSLRTLLTLIPTQSDIVIHNLPLLTGSERTQQLVDWNKTTVPYSKDKCIHQHFEAQVKQTPHAIAAICGHDQLTYKQLDQQANQLAHMLLSQGMKHNELIGVCMDRSLEMQIALLGILKAGGAYVPLDPEYPGSRLRHITQEAGISFILGQQRYARHIENSQINFIPLDQRERLTAFPTSPPP